MTYRLVVCLLILSTLYACDSPLNPKYVEGDVPLLVTPQQLTFSGLEEGQDEARLTLTLRNIQGMSLTLTSWSLAEDDSTPELSIIRSEPWNMDEIVLEADEEVSMTVLWRPVDNEEDYGQLVFAWGDGSLEVEISTSNSGDLIIGGDEGGFEAGDEGGDEGGIEAGVESGTQAGEESGTQAGEESGTQAGTMAGEDAGTMAGDDAGTMAGEDAGTMAGEQMAGEEINDADGDGYLDTDDNCANLFNPDQADSDRDGLGDLCDPKPNDFDGQVSGHSVLIGTGASSNSSYQLSSEVMLSVGTSSSADYTVTSVITN